MNKVDSLEFDLDMLRIEIKGISVSNQRLWTLFYELRDTLKKEQEQREKVAFDYVHSPETPFPSLEIKSCPECGTRPKVTKSIERLWVKCDSYDCVLYDLPVMPVEDWNKRRE